MRIDDAAEEAEGRRVLDVVDEDRAVGMRLDDMAMTPAPERPAHLLIFERMRRIVRGVQRLERHPDECDADFDDGPAADFRFGAI